MPLATKRLLNRGAPQAREVTRHTAGSRVRIGCMTWEVGLRIEVLGDLRVVGEGLSQPTRGSHRRLLSILALEPNRRIGTERLIDMFWGESPPDSARAALQTHVSALRRILGADAIATEGYGYRLDVETGALDASQFVDVAKRAREAVEVGDWEQALASSSAGLGMWRGQPYTELADDEFARAEIVRLEELYLDLWDVWAESLLRLGRTSEAIPELESLVVEHPLRERLWEHLMTSRYRLGRHVEALRAYQEYNTVLADIGLEPGPALRRLEEKILLHSDELTSTRHNLPVELTAFIGREEELRIVEKLLGAHRLVTLTGVGGSGKTRLALSAATNQLDEFPDGCWFVNLADLRDPELIPIEVAAAIGLKPQTEDPLQGLVDSLRRDNVLLVLDNCEHLREGAATVARALVTAGEGVTVLATSREPLHVPGEALFDVPPLAIPPEDVTPLDVRGYDAVRLFEDRAALVDPQFDLDGTTDMVAAVCRRLDGIPLAIELVASKVKTLGLELIRQHLNDRILSLTSSLAADIPRHQTLNAAIGWSYDLLDDEERTLFERVSVFRGGFDITMVQHMAEDESRSLDSVIDVLEGLVTKSLVARHRSESARFRLLEPVREFALQRLIDRGQIADALHHHLEWCVQFATMVESKIYGTGRYELRTRLRLESDNLLVALETAQEEADSAATSKVASALAWHWLMAGNMTGARTVLQLALQAVGDNPVREAELRARLAHAFFLLNMSDSALAEASSANEVASSSGPSAQKAAVLSRLANLRLLLVDQDPREAIPLARSAVSVARATSEAAAKIRADISLGQVLGWNGEIDEALTVLSNARDEALSLDDPELAVAAYSFTFDILPLHPTKRREMPRRLLGELIDRFPLERRREHWGQMLAWFPYVYMQSGEWAKAEEANRLLREGRMEGYDRIWYLMTHGTLCWMRGDLEQASLAMREIDEIGVNPRWYHDYYPLLADIAADAGDVEAVRAHAQTYQSVGVDPSEEAKKLGVLNPLVRAEVNAALLSDGPIRDGHIGHAKATVSEMEALLEDFPPPSDGSLGIETHGTHLAFARAELSRVTEPDPGLWRKATDRADYIYFRLYARVRLAEALVHSGDRDTALAEMESARADSQRIHARGLLRLIDCLTV